MPENGHSTTAESGTASDAETGVTDGPLSRAREAGVRTVAAVRLALSRRDSLAALGVVTGLYLAIYLLAVGDLAVQTGIGFDILVVSEPLTRMFEYTGSFRFEPIALVDAYVVRLLVSPITIGLGLVLSLLVGLNLALTYLVVAKPTACGIDAGKGRRARAGSGLLASLPALLSGTACCGPVLLIALGIQASGVLLVAFEWLLPVGVLLLLGSLVYVTRGIDTTSVAATG